MKSVTKSQRALCARALLHYRNHLIETQAEFGNLVAQDFHDVVNAENLAEQFKKESES